MPKIVVKVSGDDHRRLKVAVAEKGSTIQAVVLAAILRWLKRNEKK